MDKFILYSKILRVIMENGQSDMTDIMKNLSELHGLSFECFQLDWLEVMNDLEQGRHINSFFHEENGDITYRITDEGRRNGVRAMRNEADMLQALIRKFAI